MAKVFERAANTTTKAADPVTIDGRMSTADSVYYDILTSVLKTASVLKTKTERPSVDMP